MAGLGGVSYAPSGNRGLSVMTPYRPSGGRGSPMPTMPSRSGSAGPLGIPAGRSGTGAGTGAGTSGSATQTPTRHSPPPRAATATSPDLAATAAVDPALQALSGEHAKYRKELASGTGEIAETIAAKRRDAREGGRRSLQAASAFAGRASDPSIAGYEAETQRQVQGALSDVSMAERAMQGRAIEGGLGVTAAPGARQLEEKGFGLAASREARSAQEDAWNRELAVADREARDATQDFNEWLAVMDMQRQSPMYMG